MLHSRRACHVACQPPSTAVYVCLPLVFMYFSLTDGTYIVIGGQHFSKACLKYPTYKGSPYADLPLPNLPAWMRFVSATVLKSNTPIPVCTAAAGRHQRSQESASPSTMSVWAQYFCITLRKLKETFENGIDMDVLIRILFDSGIPMKKLLPEGGRKKTKKAKTAETQGVPTAEKTQENLTDEEVCSLSPVHVSM